MDVALWIVGSLLLYAVIGTIFGAYMLPQYTKEKYPDPPLRSVYPWDPDEIAIWRGIFWPVFLIIELSRLPGKYLVKLGLYLGQRQLMRQSKLLQKRLLLEQEQEKIRVQLRSLEQEAIQEAEECCRPSGHKA